MNLPEVSYSYICNKMWERERKGVSKWRCQSSQTTSMLVEALLPRKLPNITNWWEVEYVFFSLSVFLCGLCCVCLFVGFPSSFSLQLNYCYINPWAFFFSFHYTFFSLLLRRGRWQCIPEHFSNLIHFVLFILNIFFFQIPHRRKLIFRHVFVKFTLRYSRHISVYLRPLKKVSFGYSNHRSV